MLPPERELTESSYIVTHTVGPGHEGARIDAFLKERYPRRSRNQIQSAIEEGAIVLERARTTSATVGRLRASSPLLVGDRVLVVSERKPESPVDLNYRVLLEDAALFVVDKPGNLPVHPAGRYFFNTLLTHLRTGLAARARAGEKGLPQDYYLVHRLDKETSGVLVMTKTSESCTRLVEQFAARTTAKSYLALVHGHPAQDAWSVDAPLRRARTSAIDVRMEVAPPDAPLAGGEGEIPADGAAYPARTDFEIRSRHTIPHPVSRKPCDVALVACFPKTGRQHQIRVHLEHSGYPIVGDKLYGMPAEQAYAYFEHKHLSPEALDRLMIPRQALHAASIEFDHPVSGQRTRVEAPLPTDFAELLRARS